MMYHINHSKIWTYTFSRKCFSMILPVSTGDQGSTQWTGCRPLNMGCNDHPWHHKERVFYSSDSKWPNVTATPHMWSGLLPCSHHYDIARWVARRVRAIIYELQATIHEPRARISFTSCTFFRTSCAKRRRQRTLRRRRRLSPFFSCRSAIRSSFTTWFVDNILRSLVKANATPV